MRSFHDRFMKTLLAAILFLSFLGCKKNRQDSGSGKEPPGPKTRCGTILATPTLDSFVYPTFYVTALIAYPEGNEVVHFSGNVTGDHDGSWFLPRYDKDSTYCSTVP